MKNKLGIILLVLIFITVLIADCYSAREAGIAVESYCATAYSYSVPDYKSCSSLDRTELIKKLTKEAKQDYDTVNLPEIKG